jgi:long-subunit fatty acid transport protein
MSLPAKAHAVFNEQLAVSARAVSLANTCTADPPGLMSVHYNPAGLSLLDEGKTFSNGMALPIIRRTGKFTPNKDFKGFMNGYWGNDRGSYPEGWNEEDDPRSDHGGPDPLNNTSGTNSSGRMYIPFFKPIDFLFGSNLGLASREKNSKWTFAYANYAPYGGGMSHGDDNDPLQFGCRSLYAQHLIYAAPTASYAVSDTLSLGASVGIGQRAMGLITKVRNPNELQALTRVIGDATKDLEIPVVSEQTLPPPWLGGGIGPYEHFASLEFNMRDDFAPSVNLGLLWRPKPWFSYGLCYQSESKAEMTGKYTWQYSKQWQKTIKWNSLTPMTMESAGMLDLPINPVDTQTGTATTTQILPTRVQTGVMVCPSDKLKLLLDLHYANWARAETDDKIIFDQRIQLLRVAKMLGYSYDAYTFVVHRNMRDTWHWSIGSEFAVNDKITLRCGYEKRPTSIQHDQQDIMFFIPDADFYGLGVGIKEPNGMTLDLGFGWLMAHNFKVYNNTSTNMNSTDFTQMGNQFAGLDYHQDLDIYVLTFGVTMPLEVQLEMMKKQQEMIHHHIEKIKELIHKILPFGKKKPKEKSTEEPDEKKSNLKTDKDEEDFNTYLERLSAEYN